MKSQKRQAKPAAEQAAHAQRVVEMMRELDAEGDLDGAQNVVESAVKHADPPKQPRT